jgi:hypothetical protein
VLSNLTNGNAVSQTRAGNVNAVEVVLVAWGALLCNGRPAASLHHGTLAHRSLDDL